MLSILMKNISKVNFVFHLNSDSWEKIDFIEH